MSSVGDDREPTGKPNVLFIIADTRFSIGETMLFGLAADHAEINALRHTDTAITAGVNERPLDAMIAATDDARGAPVR